MQTQTQIEIQTTNNDTNNPNHNPNPTATSTTTPTAPPINPIAKRLARMPHIIRLPSETPPPPELKRLLEARIAEIQSEQNRLDLRDEDQAFEAAANKSILSILHQHLTELRSAFPEIDAPPTPTPPQPTPAPLPSISPIGPVCPISPIPPTPPMSAQLTKQKNAEITELTEPAIQPQPHPTEPQVSSTEPGSLTTEPTEPTEPRDPNTPPPLTSPDEEQFDLALKKIPEDYREAAADLYELVHYRSKFSKLTSEQRQAVYELSDLYRPEDALKIFALPVPAGFGLKTSLAGLKRFRSDYRRILMDEKKLAAHCRTEEQRVAAESAFQQASASEETFRQATAHQLRKRLFETANDPNSDHKEIRSLLKSLELLRKPDAKPTPPNP
jgi:hypothetical protein